MSDEQDKLKVSLEPPKLFGRKKKSGNSAKADKGLPDRPSEPARPAEPEEQADPTPEPATGPVVETEPTAETAPEVAETAATTAPAVKDVPEAEAAVEPEADSEPEPEAEAEAEAEVEVERAAEVEAEPEVEPDAEVEPDVDAEADVVEADAEPEPAVATELEAEAEPEADPAAETETEAEPDGSADGSRKPAAAVTAGAALVGRLTSKVRDRFGPKDPAPEEPTDPDDEDAEIISGGYVEPMLGPYPAAVLTGGIVGLAMVVLTWLSLRGCEAIQGVSSCGGSYGFPLLIAIFVAVVLLGSAILKNFHVPDPGSSSFLAVGLVAVVALLLLIDVLDHWSMLIVIPALSIGSFVLSVYVTKTFVEPSD